MPSGDPTTPRTLLAVIGNPNPGGRTTQAASAVLRQVDEALGGGSNVEVLELASIAAHLFEWDSTEVEAATARVAAADLVVFACPTYKASYTGLLKAFLDRYPGNGLAGSVGIALMIGGNALHALAPEVHLRPLLVELGVSVPTRALYVLDTEMDQLDDNVTAWLDQARGPLVAALG